MRYSLSYAQMHYNLSVLCQMSCSLSFALVMLRPLTYALQPAVISRYSQ